MTTNAVVRNALERAGKTVAKNGSAEDWLHDVAVYARNIKDMIQGKFGSTVDDLDYAIAQYCANSSNSMRKRALNTYSAKNSNRCNRFLDSMNNILRIAKM
jgi:hypothetical protein